jgi:hypothetical protein
MRLGVYGQGVDSDLSVLRSCAVPGLAEYGGRLAARADSPTRHPRPPRAGARFTYGVYLQESLQVPDAVDLTASQPLDQLAGNLRLLQADHTVSTSQHWGARGGPSRPACGTHAHRAPPRGTLELDAGVGLGGTPTSSTPIPVCPLQNTHTRTHTHTHTHTLDPPPPPSPSPPPLHLETKAPALRPSPEGQLQEVWG